MKEDDLYQKIHGNMIFSVYMHQCYKRSVALLAKKTMPSSRKYTLKGGISGIAEKDNIHPRKCGISVEISY